jgi:hypothetical protein
VEHIEIPRELGELVHTHGALRACVVFRVCPAGATAAIQHWKSYYRLPKDQIRYRELATKMLRPATHCWAAGANYVHKGKPIVGPEVEGNSLYKYAVVIATGPTREAGYVICATLPAKDDADAARCIEAIQNIMQRARDAPH